jgi:phosphoribosyl 1,2-cyclic phosphodiesterase
MTKQYRSEQDEIIFLGTGGARYVIARQTRATGGILFNISGKKLLVDPGPESLARFLAYVPGVNPESLDGVILTHKHIDHSADINVYLDILTRGGFKRGGHLIAPQDAFGVDGVVFSYLIEHIERIDIIKPKLKLAKGDIIIDFPMRHIHPVETYGLKIKTDDFSISYISDTKFTPSLITAYNTDILIMNLLRLNRSEIEHLSVPDCIEIVNSIRPRAALITHFGMTMLRAGPSKIAQKIQEETGVSILAAEDGKHYQIKKLLLRSG